MTDQEKIKLLAEMLGQFADCESPHWTCLEDMDYARENPDAYDTALRQKKMDGEELCLGCRARELLTRLELSDYTNYGGTKA